MSTIQEEIKRLEQKDCTCVVCASCRGNGTYRVDMFTGFPQDSLDDLYDLETCEECHAGIIEVCDRCREIEELYSQIEDQEYLRAARPTEGEGKQK